MATAPQFRPSGQDELAPSGRIGRIQANLEALRVLRVLQDERRPAAPGEQSVLARYSSWGAVPQIFDERKDEFADYRAELRGLLTEDEYAAARRTTLNAHYTSTAMVRTVWEAVEGLGFNGGTVLEPGCGSGNFIGYAPPSARMLGIELDPVTAGIAAALYPDAEIRAESFADTRIQPGGFDLAVGNVPFSSAILTDDRHNRARHSMHNHFIVKSLDAVRPGGLVAVLTSRYTMDAVSDSARQEMSARADLLTAIRLPSGAHRRAAGTEAVTDLLILRRREEDRPVNGTGWGRSVPAEFEGGNARVNEYFLAHPENVLGDLVVGGSQYSSEELMVRPRDLARVPDELADRLAVAVADAHEAGLAVSPRDPALARANVQSGGGHVSLRIPARDAGRFEGTITAHRDGTFTVLHDGQAEPWPCPDSQSAELRALLRLRDTVCSLLDAERASAEDTTELASLRARLNREYDAYVRTHGALNRVQWRRTGRTSEDGSAIWARQAPAQGKFRQDPHAAIVYALEDFDSETGIASKAPIFTSRVIKDRQPADSAQSPADAIAICMDADGQVRLERAAALLGLSSHEEARAALGELVYDEPGTGRLVPAAEYLSGKVRAKLHDAEKAAEADPRFAVNAAALRKVLPSDLGPGEIDARLGASWIPPELVQQGLREILQDRTLTAVKGYGSTWKVTGDTGSVAARDVYGTADKDAIALAQHVLEQRPIKVTYSMDDLSPAEKAQLSSAHGKEDMAAFMRQRAASATIAARAKADELSDRFAEWLWEDPQRSASLARTYNELFNSLVSRTYDDVRPRLPGLAEWFKPHPHQYAAVARIINEPAVLLAHEVGAGKTAEMAMGCMELRRLNLAAKPAIVVPNHMLKQFEREFLQLYPQASVLACGMKDLQKDRRKAFVARIATGDWDAVIMSRSVFERIPMSAADQERYITAKLADYDLWLENAAEESEDPRMVKRMENQRLSFEERLKRKLSRAKDTGITWEQSGVDYLFVDEAHGYKNRDTRSNSPALDIDGSGRAADLEMKLDYLRRQNGNRVVTFATATPIANSMTEAYVMLSYLRPDLLKDAGIEDFDGWAGSFASAVSDVEVAPEGGLRVKERIARFRNLPELLLMWLQVADVKTGEDLKEYLKVPDLAGGKPEVVTVPPSQQLRAFMMTLADRADDVRTGSVPPKEDNMLKISSDGRAAALDLRLAGWNAPDEDGKLDIAAARIAQIYRENRDNVYRDQNRNPERIRGALQIVFCELGTPTGSAKFGAYEYLKARIADQGVPSGQVRFMHEARNDKEKDDLFRDARAGKVSVLIGTTELMGVGTNVQKRAVALHHLDCPWRPADVAQREGRLLRQGNQNANVQILRYVTERSFDAYMWQTVLRKARFIAQIMQGRLDSREIEDIGGSEALSYSEVTALATGDMRILAKARADAEVQRLSRLEASWRRSQRHLKIRITGGQREIPRLREKITRLEAALSRRASTTGDAFHCTLNGTPFTKRTEAADELQTALERIYQQAHAANRTGEEASATPLGTFGGFALEGTGLIDSYGVYAVLRFSDIPFGTVLVRPSNSRLGIITKLENKLSSLDTSLAAAQQELADTEEEVNRARQTLGTPFAKAEELTRALDHADQLAAELGSAPLPRAEPDAHETPVTGAAREGEENEETGADHGETWDRNDPGDDRDENPLDDAAAGVNPRDWEDRPDKQAADPSSAAAAPDTGKPSGSPVHQEDSAPGPEPAVTPPAEESVARTSSEPARPDSTPAAEAPEGSALPPGTNPVSSHLPWNGPVRPERLVYRDGTELVVTRAARDGGEEAVLAVAAGSKAMSDSGDFRGGHFQVVQWHDGSYGLAHPARVRFRGVDPYAGLDGEDRARWDRFDRYESYGESIAYLPAHLVQAGDSLQLKRGTRGRPAELAPVWSASGNSGPDGSIHFTLPGHKQGLTVPSDRQVGVQIPGDHPTLHAAITAVTGNHPDPVRPDDSRDTPTEREETAAVPVPAPSGKRPTAEQQAIIDACVSGQNLVIEAGAGAGKTSTLRMAAAAMTGRTGIYVAYNRAIANEASGSFPSNVACSTAHSLAFRAIGRNYAHRLPPKSRRMPAREIADLLGIREPLDLGEGITLAPAQLAGIVMGTVEKFCQSADSGIGFAHLPKVNGVTAETLGQVRELVLPLAVRAWSDLNQTDGRLPFQHDHYLKMWQLTGPDLNADFILFDEAQDANPVTAAIIQGQRNTQKIAVGDSCQAIYGWRGAVDALATWPADQRLYLSQSFRFGEAVATEANKWLENLGATLRLKGTPTIPSTIGTLTEPDAVLCRTNAEAVSQALTFLDRGSRVALVGGGDDIKRLAQAARELQQRGFTNHPELAAFTSWHAVQEYVRDDDSGADLATFVRLVDSHGPDAVIRTVEQLSSEEDAEVTISTAHKSKGREWDRVLIAGDFREPKVNNETGTPGTIPRADAMLAYVAVTRAKQQLDRQGLEWIDNYTDGTPAEPAANRESPASRPQASATMPVHETPGRPEEGTAAKPSPAASEPAATAAEPSSTSTAAAGPADVTSPAPAVEASGSPAATIRIEHDDEGTRVYGTDKSNKAVNRALKDAGFKWSRSKRFWYLNRSWKKTTRDARVRQLRSALDQLGETHEYGPETPADAPPAGSSSHSERPAQASEAPAAADTSPEPSKTPPENASAVSDEKVSPDTANVSPSTTGSTATEPAANIAEETATSTEEEPHAVVPLGGLADIPVDPRPYTGSRAQAESGSMIIERDYLAWQLVHDQAGDNALPAEHPRVVQFTRTWRAVRAKGLADGPGPSAIRYHSLAHAAIALASVTDSATGSGEIDALNILATHARKHSVRLHATADQLFSQSRKADRYANGRSDAERGSRIIENDYRAWSRTGAPVEAARDPLLWQHARRTELAWHAVRRSGLTDGPAPAAARYRELADATKALANEFTVTLPSYSLNHLLELADHAEKHATRLGATARPRQTSAQNSQSHHQDDRGPAPLDNANHDLSDHLASVTEQARASSPQTDLHQRDGSDDGQAARRNIALQREAAHDNARPTAAAHSAFCFSRLFF